jgi:SAM-dependent methyltransferase
MSENIPKSVADSLESDPLLLPYMPFLLQDLWALGADVESIIRAIDSLGLASSQTNVLDLGCGKGAVSIRIAMRFGFRVFGVDAMAPFIEDAITKSRQYNVFHLCTFKKQDIFQFLKTEHQFDIVIFASLGGLLGTFQETVGKLRQQVRKGAYIVIDDGYLKKGDRLNRKRYEHYRNHDKTMEELTCYGDILIDKISTAEATERINKDYLQIIQKRGKELVKLNPELKSTVESYVALQIEECQIIAEKIEGVLWVLKKGV